MAPRISTRYRMSSTPEWTFDCFIGGAVGLLLWGVLGAIFGAIFGVLVGLRPGARRRHQQAKLRHLQLRSAARQRAAAKATAAAAEADGVAGVPPPPVA